MASSSPLYIDIVLERTLIIISAVESGANDER